MAAAVVCGGGGGGGVAFWQCGQDGAAGTLVAAVGPAAAGTQLAHLLG